LKYRQRHSRCSWSPASGPWTICTEMALWRPRGVREREPHV